MVCTYCSGKTQVINSRPQKRTNQVWRRRQCLACSAVFTTGETTDYSATWMILTPDGAITPFSRDKLLMSLYKSLQHRPSALVDAGGLADTVITKLIRTQSGATIKSTAIIQIVQVALHRFDSAASVHYAAFHK